MADRDQPQENAKPSNKKTVLVVAALMLVEAGVVFGLVYMSGAGARSAAAGDLVGQQEADRETAVEVLLVEEKFQNMQSGRVWLWDTSIYLQVRRKNLDRVNADLERRRAEINEGVARIFRRAQDRHLREPGLETINRQLTTYLNQVFGNDVDGMSRVERVIVPRCKGFPADF